MKWKEKHLLEKYRQHKYNEDLQHARATWAKYSAILAGASAGIATIAAIVTTIETNLDYGLGVGSLAITMGLISKGAYDSYKKHEKKAKQAHTKARNTQRSLNKCYKQR